MTRFTKKNGPHQPKNSLMVFAVAEVVLTSVAAGGGCGFGGSDSSSGGGPNNLMYFSKICRGHKMDGFVSQDTSHASFV